eukprot:15475085-Alexandrium_andersonii.AAC.1
MFAVRRRSLPSGPHMVVRSAPEERSHCGRSVTGQATRTSQSYPRSAPAQSCHGATLIGRSLDLRPA